MEILVGVVILLIIMIIVMLIRIVSTNNKLQLFKNTNEKINNLKVLQDFMNITGEDISVDEKLKKINHVIIDKFNLKYSTIVVFNGAEYILKASNVDEKHWEALKNLHTEEIFKDSIETGRSKYITVGKNLEKLPYQKMEFARAQSAEFFPLYIDNIYIGYWIIESGEPHAFDGMDNTILEVVRENIVTVLKTVNYQNTVENIYRKDQFTELYSAEYLYGVAKKSIDRYPTSTVCMFNIINIEKINEKINRQMGNKAIIQISNIIKANISSEYIFVRYMGPKFVIVFSGVEPEGVIDFMSGIKQQIENVNLVQNNEEKKARKAEIIRPKLNFIISTYYKGTGLEAVTKKLEEYLDNADKEESTINSI